MVQVGVHWLSPGDYTRVGVECGAFYGKAIGLYKGTQYVKGGRSPFLIPRDKKRSVEVLYMEDSEHSDQKK